MKPTIIPFLFCLFFLVFVSTVAALDVRGSPLKYISDDLSPSQHTLDITNTGESTLILSENLQPVCTVDPLVLNGSGQFTISCSPTSAITGTMTIMPYQPENMMIKAGVQIPVQLGDVQVTTEPTTTPTTTTSPVPTQETEIPVTIFGLSFEFMLLIVMCAIAVVSGIYYLLFVHKYD